VRGGYFCAGAVLNASVESVQSALAEVSSWLTARFPVVPVRNGNQSTSWPIVILNSVATLTVISNSSDCQWATLAQQLLSWTLLNLKGRSLAAPMGIAPLPFHYIR
jgi:hypothetical protein